MGPNRELEERSRRRRLLSCPKEGGIVPEMLVEERLRSWRDEREESSEGKEERLRKMLGREREITLFCGEHVIPCHEHGVWLDGFHEESTKGDCFAGRRERRAWPSGDREETKVSLVIVMKMMNNMKEKREEGLVQVSLWFSIWVVAEERGLMEMVKKWVLEVGDYGGGGESLL